MVLTEDSVTNSEIIVGCVKDGSVKVDIKSSVGDICELWEETEIELGYKDERPAGNAVEEFSGYGGLHNGSVPPTAVDLGPIVESGLKDRV